ncbi:MAG: SDR family NAD(P)-dependent oxidoreductase [Anaerolineales bacterium]
MEKLFVVTGATSGIGLAVTEALVKQGVFVIGVGRNPERAAALEARLRGGCRLLTADLALQSQVRALAAALRGEVEAAGRRWLDGLINNAGVFTFRRTLTAEGIEMQWAVNHLAPFLLTNELLPLLAAAPQARVVTVSSGSHYRTRLRWHDLQLRRFYNGLLAYKQTKLCNVLFTLELRRRLGPGSRVQAFAADPGLVFTEMGFKGNPRLVRWIWALRRRGGITPAESAAGIVFLALEPSIQQAAEIYWKHGRPKAPDPAGLDLEAAHRLWEISARMCGLA